MENGETSHRDNNLLEMSSNDHRAMMDTPILVVRKPNYLEMNSRNYEAMEKIPTLAFGLDKDKLAPGNTTPSGSLEAVEDKNYANKSIPSDPGISTEFITPSEDNSRK